MSLSYRRSVAKKLKETILASKDPKEIAALANQLAKFLPKLKQPRGRPRTPSPIKAKELTLEDLVAAVEKKRRGLSLSAEELKMVAAVEKKRGESAEGA